MEEAYSALTRIKAEGGPGSFSYKNYNLPARSVFQGRNCLVEKLLIRVLFLTVPPDRGCYLPPGS